MCRDCGCGDSDLVPVEVQQRILSSNDVTAGHNREHFLAANVLALNLMGSPGSGKTAILEATALRLSDRLRLGAISGDLATDNDEKRLRKAGIPSGTITTGQGCHLDARLVHDALHHFPLAGLDVFVIENVGNLVCPAIYDLGEAARVVALSVTEGEDKPLKYPVMFQHADLVLLTKSDLIPHLGTDLSAIADALARVMPKPRSLLVSARTGEGLDAFIEWLEERKAGLAAAGSVDGHAGRAGHDHPHVQPPRQ
jgi:hydrogenase nickel incorporation protein HypB